MKIIEKSKMPDGTKIQLEDWHDKNTKDYMDLYGYEIGAYPVATNSGCCGWVKSGEKFRISISYNKYANYNTHTYYYYSNNFTFFHCYTSHYC